MVIKRLYMYIYIDCSLLFRLISSLRFVFCFHVKLIQEWDECKDLGECDTRQFHPKSYD